MSRSGLSLATLMVGLAAVGFALTRPARAQTSEAKSVAVEVPVQEFQHVKVQPLDKGAPEVEGKLKIAAIVLRTNIGTHVIDVKNIRRITFPLERSEDAHETIQLSNKEIIRGQMASEKFPIETAEGMKEVDRSQIREIIMIRDEKPSVVNIAIGLLTLTAMEIVLGIDNVIFLAIVSGRLPREQQRKARRLGLGAALGTRLLLLFSLTFLLGLTAPIFTLPSLPMLHDVESREVSWRDLILLGGGLFLIGKSVLEMHEKIEHAKKSSEPGGPTPPARVASFARTIATIAVIDIVFSLDSVITAVGMVEHLEVMIVAMVIAMGVMLVFAESIARFVDNHPTIKVLALAFLILIGVMLVAEGFGQHIDKGYIYFAMAFSIVIELINMRLRGGHKPAEAPSVVSDSPAS